MKRGFTIVELLVVIVVIAILAAVTVVAYNGVQKRATVSGMQSTLGQMVKKIETNKTNNNDSYAAVLPLDTPDSIRNNDKTPLRYFQRNSGTGFCADTYSIQFNDLNFFADSDHLSPQVGLCPEGPAITSFSADYTVLTYDLNAAGCNGSTIQLPIASPSSAAGSIIDWGDGSSGSLTSSLQSHTYSQKKEYTVGYKGPIATINGSSITAANKACFTQVKQWSNAIAPTQMSYLGGANFIYVAEPPHTVTNMTYMLANAPAFNQNINSWDTTNVTDMSFMFSFSPAFNQPLGSWNTSSVTNMNAMFYSASAFNQPIGTWNTGNVTNMYALFDAASAFNQPLGSWNTSKVTDMGYMFISAYAFNQPIGTWNTSNVTNMNNLFNEAYAFNQPINSWDTGNVTNMEGMFGSDFAFNQPISSWNTSKVTNMVSMFRAAYAFNQPIGSWNTSSVTNMLCMFYNASSFNQNIASWNVGVTSDWTLFRTNSPLTNVNTPPKFL